MSKHDLFYNIMLTADFCFETEDFDVAVCYIAPESDIGIEEDLDISIFNKTKDDVTFDIPHEQFLEIKRMSWDKLYANQKEELLDQAIDKAEDEKINKSLGY